jgi:hypothetical protein
MNESKSFQGIVAEIYKYQHWYDASVKVKGDNVLPVGPPDDSLCVQLLGPPPNWLEPGMTLRLVVEEEAS